MQNSTLIVIGSLIITAVVLVSLASGYMLPRRVTAPEAVPAEVEVVQRVVCNSTRVDGHGYTLYLPSEYKLYMDVYIKSVSKDAVTVDEIRPLTASPNLPPLKTLIVLPPGSVHLATVRPPWGRVGELTVTAYPGDVYVFRAGGVELAEPGLIGKYTSGIVGSRPASYTCPLGGRHQYALSVSGTEIRATISEPGCAPITLAEVKLDTVFIVGELSIVEYYYEDWDIPLYIHIGGAKLGIYYRGGPEEGHGFGLISLYDGAAGAGHEYKPGHGNPFIFGYYYSRLSGVEELYVDDGRTPVRTNTVGGYIVSTINVGVARAKPAGSAAPPIRFYAYYWSGGHHYIEIDYSSQEYRIVKDGRILVSGSFEIHGPGENVKPDLVGKGIAVIENPTPDVDTIIPVVAGSTWGGLTTYWFYLPAMPGAKMDLIIAWEDMVGYYPPGSPGIDGNGDEWVRVTYFGNGTWRIAGFIAEGGFEHVFALGDRRVFVKPYGTGWVNKCGSYYCEYRGYGLPRYVHMPWREHAIASDVNLVVMRDKTIVLEGLYPGDKVIVKSAHATRTYVARGSMLSIDVVKEFGLKEVFDTVEGGGFRILVVPSQQHLLHLIPASVLVHVKTSSHDMWVKTDAPLVVECVERIYVHSNNVIEFVANTSDYTVWSAYFNGNPLGAFPSIVITVQDGSVALHTERGVYTYKGPVRITLAPPRYVGVARGGVQLETVPYVHRVEVIGRYYAVDLSAGK